MTERELLYVLLKKVEASLPGEFRRLRVVAFTRLIAESMLSKVVKEGIVHLPLLEP